MRILLPYWRGVPKDCFYQEFHQGISEALQEFGHSTLPFYFADRRPIEKAEAASLYQLTKAENFDAVLDIACWGWGLSRFALTQPDGKSTPIFDEFAITYAGWLFDQPWNQQMTGVMADKHYAIYPDRSHSNLTRLIYPHLQMKGEIFAPPAVRWQNDRCSRDVTQERPIDILYIGNLVPEALERGWQSREAVDADFCDALADAAFAVPESSLRLAVQKAASSCGERGPGFNLRLHLHVVENHIRHVIRRDAVTSCANSNARMCVVGKGWDRISFGTNVDLIPETDYQGIFGLAAQAKICVDASTYFDGVNDRVFSYAVNGAVSLTNASGYLRGAFDGNPGICFYSLSDRAAIGGQINSLLSRPRALREAGNSAKQAVLSKHTWRNRIGHILPAMRL